MMGFCSGSIHVGGIQAGRPLVSWQVQPRFQVLVVVVAAQQGQVVQVSVAAVSPRNDVVAFAPVGGVGAVGEAAAAVAGDQRKGLGVRGDPSGPAEEQLLPGRAEDDRHDLGLVGELQGGGGGDQRPVGGFGHPGPSEQVGQVEVQDHRGRGATRIGQPTRSQHPAGQVTEGVVHPLGIVPLIRPVESGGSRPRKWGQDREQPGADLGGELAFEPVSAVALVSQGQVAAAVGDHFVA